MPNAPGTPIWYELMTPDAEGAKRFYEAVVGWSVGEPPPGPVDYRMISASGTQVGGVLHLSDEMLAGGARPGWLLYVGVSDADATVEQARALGAQVLAPPTDIPGVGRFSLLVDPQGAPFYVMQGAAEGVSEAFAPGRTGHCSWNELWTTDLRAALGFYGALFGWENRETMDMGPMGGYHFLDLRSVRLGAAAEMRDQPSRWNAYFEVASMDAAVDRVRAGGGAVAMGPQEVPTGQTIVLGTDPQGAPFALVTPPAAAHA